MRSNLAEPLGFLKEFKDREYFNQCTNSEELEQLMSKKKIKAYIGFDCTASSLHVGSLLQIMCLRLLQKHGHQPIVLLGGGTTPTKINTIEYFTIATLGNAQDFGDLTQTGMDGDVGAVSNSTRVVFGGGSSATPARPLRMLFPPARFRGGNARDDDVETSCASSSQTLSPRQKNRSPETTYLSPSGSRSKAPPPPLLKLPHHILHN